MKKLVSHIICVLFLLGSYAQSGDIQLVQYYFDTDPGVGQVGNGGIIDLLSPTSDLDQSFNWTLPPDLAPGFHYLYVRGRSSDNTWSMHEDALFYLFDPDLFGPDDDPADIAGMEYFLDDDPGVGNGTAIALTTTPTSGLSESVTITLPSDIASGFHYLYVRARSSDNTWSLHEEALFYVFDPDVFGPNDDPADIAAMEYFLDDDPGVGNGTAIPLNTTPTTGLTESVTIALPSDIASGFHYLYVRARSSDNTWSLHEEALFYVFDPDLFGPNDDPADIAAMEYFLDDDPGVGNGTAIPLNTTPTTGLTESVTIALPSDIASGFHRLYFRAKSSDNTWSMHEDGLFYVMDPDVFGPDNGPAEIVELEYYYDQDPGPGEGHRIPIDTTSSLNMTIPIEAPCLDPGEHFLYLRAMDSDGNWSLFGSDTLDLQPEVSPAVISPAGPLFLCDGDTLLLTVPETVELAYQWVKDGVDISGETGNTLLIDDGGDYALRSTCLGESALSDLVSVTLVIPDVPTITPDGPTTFCAGSDVTLTSSLAESYLWSTGATTQAITVSTSDDYSVTTIDEYGCSASSLATTVVRNPNPAIPTISSDGPLNFCDGEDVVLTSSSAAGYLWSTGATTQSITVSTSDSYSVTVTNANGCSRTSAVTEVTVFPLPNTPTISADGPTTFCDGESVTLTSSAEDSYLWSTGAITQTILVSTSDSYSVTVTTADGCSASSSSTIVIVQSNSTWYADTDEDGYGDVENPTEYCVQPAGFVSNSLDCDDTDEFINPDSEEVCDNAEDDNCDGEIDENCLDCTVFDTAPVDLTKSFDPVNGVQDRVQVKWFKAIPQVRYADEDAAACDIKFWPKRNLIPGTTTPTGPVIVAGPSDTIDIVNAKKFYPDGITPREIFKWPVKFRADGANNNKRAEPNIRYEWKVRCACEHGVGQESPWSDVKIFNTPDFDPSTGIYTAPGDIGFDDEVKLIAASEAAFILYPNPNDGKELTIVLEDNEAELIDIQVMSIAGAVLYKQREIVKGDRLKLNFSNTLSNGMYFIHLNADGKISTQRFVVR